MKKEFVLKKMIQLSGEDRETCEKIISAYNKYRKDEIKLPFTKENDAQMIDWISFKTSCSRGSVELVLSILIPIIRDNKNKEFLI
ncbi:hypothetical protein [Enterococcus sp. AZ196]|uniref:hypothetical protein n=1 Tax=Enterococcus sp. AZ196 TaxID=2774659 RepID=UPI003D29F7DC